MLIESFRKFYFLTSDLGLTGNDSEESVSPSFVRALLQGVVLALKSRVQRRGHSLKFYLLIVVIVTFTTAMIFRVYDAYLQGDVWLAFSRRSDVGYPIAQILALIALATLLYLRFGLKKTGSLKEKRDR